jgi:hypothetical protein
MDAFKCCVVGIAEGVLRSYLSFSSGVVMLITLRHDSIFFDECGLLHIVMLSSSQKKGGKKS